jgi:hypothetical protein
VESVVAPCSARMFQGSRRTIVSCIAAGPTEDVTTMLNQLHTAADLAAEHRRALQAEADAYRLARTARSDTSAPGARPVRRRGWLRLLRATPRAAGTA